MWGRATSFIRGVVSGQVHVGPRFLTAVLLFLQILTIPAAFAATYSGGSGIDGNPYLISTPADLLTLSNPANSGDWSKHFLMTNDIDMTGVTGFTPIGDATIAFSGAYDGNFHTVQHLDVSLPEQDYVGAFGRLSDASCLVKNLGVYDCTVAGHNNVGGLVGYLHEGTVTACYTTGAVEGSLENIGGLVGGNNGAITECFSAAHVTAVAGGYEGGLVGSNFSLGSVIACYASGTVSRTGSGGIYIGGLAGVNSGNVTACYSTGEVRANGGSYVGGLAGGNAGVVTGSVWNVETGGNSGGSAGKGLSTTQMKTLNIFRNAGWGSYPEWVMDEGNYPRLSWEGTGADPIPAPEPVPLNGSGTDDDPYLVGTAAEFALLSWHFSILDKNLRLVSDIDCAGTLLYPIGDLGPFTGAFNGGGHAIRNLAIEQPSNKSVGVFSRLHAGGTIDNFGIENATIIGDEYVGALVGWNEGTLNGCYASGTVSGAQSIGGLVGWNSGTVYGCHTIAALTGRSNYVGGLIGYVADEGIVANSWSNCAVSTDSSAGGLIGANGGAISSCKAAGEVTSRLGAGGLVGENYANGTVVGCYAEAVVIIQYDGGGLVSTNYGTISGCYAAATIGGNSDYGGGLIASNTDSGTIRSSFWEIGTSQRVNSYGGKGLTSSQMKTVSIFQNAGWGAYGWVMNDGTYPRLSWENTGASPIPSPEPVPLFGSGTEADPYCISSALEFAALSWHVSILDKHILLVADLDCAEVILYPIGDLGPFVGVFAGAKHILRNVSIDQPGNAYVGVFGIVNSGGEVRDLIVENSIIRGDQKVGSLVGSNNGGSLIGCYVNGELTGEGEAVGGMVGSSSGAITNCHSEGIVDGGGNYVGGLVGVTSGTVAHSYSTSAVRGGNIVGGLGGRNFGSVSGCSASGTVTGPYVAVGGLLGDNWGSVSDCYANGTVTGVEKIGGLVGENFYSAITRCYATSYVGGETNVGGLVGSLAGGTPAMITSSFWDTTVGGPDNGIGTGLPTAQMKQRATFEGAGWDFSGSPPVWYIFEGQSYPQLFGIPVPVDSIDALQALSTLGTGSFFLTRDLDARETEGWGEKSTEPGFVPIGTLAQPFNGTLDGRKHRIYGLHIYRPALDGVGLIGALGPNGVVRGIGLEGVTITGGNQSGGLVGSNQGMIEQCYVQGTVAGASGVGGLLGTNAGTVDESYAAADVAGTTPGGLIGIGGGSVSRSFWDTDVSGTTSSAGGTGLGTGAMMNAGSYVNASWDFTDTWALAAGLSYPYFQNSLLLRVVAPPPRLIDADAVDVEVETFVPGLFVTIGGGAYPAYSLMDTASTGTITVPLKQEAINKLRVSTVSETGLEAVHADYVVYESTQFPPVPTAVTSVRLQPMSLGLAEGGTQQFTCTATFADGTTGDVSPTCSWNASGGTITGAGLYTQGLVPGTVQALLNTGQGWLSSGLATIATAKSGAGPKTGTGKVSGVVRSHYTGLGLPAGRVTAYNIFNPNVAGQHPVQDTLGNYSFFMLEGAYHFEGSYVAHRSDLVLGGVLLEPRRLLDPGPPAEYSEPHYSGQVKDGRPLLYDFSLRPNDTQAPWVVFIEPVADTTVSSNRIVVTAIDADQYSELAIAKYAHNAQEHAIPDKISSTGFYRETWPLQQGINVLHLFTMDTEGNASEKTIQITYDPDYTGPGGDSDGDGMPNLWETSHGLNAQSSTGVNGADGDLDGDGIRNIEEYQRGTFPNADRSDSDTLTDREEVLLGTNPLAADTDGDGVNDDVEWAQGSNPLRDDRIKMKVVNLTDGASVRGNAVTLLADVLFGYSLGGVASASFQVRGTGTGNVWRVIGASTSAPFIATWDTTALASGTYELRAVATSRAGCVDGTPSAISITISASAPHFERVVGGVYTLTAPVKSAQNNLIALRDGARFARITIPSGAVAANDVLTASFPSPSSFTPVLSTFQVNADLYLSLSLATHSGTFLAGKKATIEVGYPDADSDDHLDGSDLRVNYLKVNYLPTPSGSFTALLSRGLDRLNHFVITTTDHFSTFGVIEEQPAPPLNLLTDALPDGTAGAAYNVLLEANGGAAPRTWAVTSGTLPAGLGLVGASVQGTPTTPETYTFTLRVSDTQSTPQSVSRSFTIQIAAANQPSVTVTRAPGQLGNTNQLPARWDIVFSEAVNGFNTSDVVLTGSAATGATFAVSGSGSNYLLEVTALTRDGTLHPTTASGKASSIATGALNSASANEEEVWVDRQAPQVWIASTASTPTPTGPIMVQTLPVAFTVTFNEAVYGFDETDISFAGNPPGLALDVLGSGTTFNIVVTGVGAAATLTPSLNADGAADRAGNGIPAAAYTGREIQYNPETRRTVMLEQQPAQADPANVLPIVYDIVFSQPVNGFSSTDVAYAGTASNPQYNVTGSGAAYTLTVTSTSGDGRLAFQIPEDVTTEGNAASTSMDNMVTLDTTPPSLTIGPPSVTTTRQGPVNFIVAYTDASTISLNAADIILNGAPTTEVTVTPGATVNHRLVTLSGIGGLGSLGISIAAGTAEDAVANLAPAAGPSATVAVDPDLSVTVNQATAQRDPTNHAPILFDVQFVDPVIGFNALDVTIGGSAVGVTHNVTGSGANFTIAVTGVAGAGTIVPTIPAGVCLGQWDGINGASTSTDNVITYNPALAMAEFSASPSEGVAPLSVPFTDESILGTLPITTWFWDFGDGNTSTEQNPEHTYEEPGDYTVSLTVTTSSTTNTFTKNNYIQVDSALPGVTSYRLFLTIILVLFIAARMLSCNSIKGRGNISE